MSTRANRNESYINISALPATRHKKRTGESMNFEKENVNSNNLSIHSLTRIAKQGYDSLKGSPLSELFKTRKLESPGVSKLDTKRDFGSPSLNPLGKKEDVLALEKRKRNLTPKTIKDLLAEKRKKNSASPAQEEASKGSIGSRVGPPLKIGDIIALKNRKNLAAIPFKSNDQSHQSVLSSPSQPNAQKKTPSSPPGSPTAVAPAASLLKTPPPNSLYLPFELVSRKGRLVSATCINHLDRKSKFFVLQDSRVVQADGSREYLRGVCSKCGVRLANHGFHVEELETDEEEASKVEEFNQFISRVTSIRKLNQLALRDAERKQTELGEHYRKESLELDKLNRRVEELCRFLKDGVDQVRICLQKEAERESDKFSDIIDILNENERDIRLFAENLHENFDDTIRTLDLEGLRGNISRFSDHLKHHENSSRKSLESRVSVLSLAKLQQATVAQVQEASKQLFRAKQEILRSPDPHQSASEVLQVLQELDQPVACPPHLMHAASNVFISFDANTSFHVDGHATKPQLNLRPAEDGYFSVLEAQNETQSDFSVQTFPGDPLFILSPTEADFAAKQTPELGQKAATPPHLEEYLALLRQNNEKLDRSREEFHRNSVHSRVSRRPATPMSERTVTSIASCEEDLFNFIGRKHDANTSLGQSKCKKILFSEKDFDLHDAEEEDPAFDERLLGKDL